VSKEKRYQHEISIAKKKLQKKEKKQTNKQQTDPSAPSKKPKKIDRLERERKPQRNTPLTLDEQSIETLTKFD